MLKTDFNTDKAPLPGLADLAKIIETLIGKVKLSIKDITVKVFASHTRDFLSISLKELKLKDHVAEDFDIPSELLSQEVDVLSFIVKYLVATDSIATFHLDDGPEIPLLKISVTWIRVIFSQNDDPLLISGAASPTLSNHSSSALFSDFQLKAFAYGMSSIIRIKDIKRIKCLFEQTSDSPVPVHLPEDPLSHLHFDSSDLANGPHSSSLFQFSFYCNSATFCIIPSSANPPTLEMYESLANNPLQDSFWIYPHLLLLIEKIKFHKSSDGKIFTFVAKKLEVKQFHPSNSDYECIIRSINQGEYKSTTKVPQTTIDLESEIQMLQVDFIPSSILTSWSLSAHVSSVLFDIKLNHVKLWRTFFESESSKPASPSIKIDNTLKKNYDKGYIEIEITRVFIMADLSMDNERGLVGVFLDISKLHLQSEEIGDSWSIETPSLSVGFYPMIPQSRSIASLHLSHAFTFSKIIVGIQGNDFYSNTGLSDEFINARHGMARESVSIDTLSTKSWSDVESESDVDRAPPSSPVPRPTKVDLIDPILLKAKFIITIHCLKFEGSLNNEEVGNLRWVIDTIQSLNANNPPEPTRFPTTFIVSLNQCELDLRTRESLFKMRLDEIDFVLGLSSFQNTKNIAFFDLFCDAVTYESTLKSMEQWKFVKRISDKKEMIHILFSQCEDLDIEIRQMKLTSCLNDFSLYLPDLLGDILFPVLPPSLNDAPQPESLVSTFLDLVVAFSDCNITHSLMEKHVVFKADSFQIASNLLSASPTKGFTFLVYNAEILMGINPLLRNAFHDSFQNNEKNFYEKIASLCCVSVISLDSLTLDIRTNPAGVFPLFDYRLGFNQITIETCSDSRTAVIEYLVSLFPSKLVEQSLREHHPSVPSKMVDTFDSVDDTAFESKTVASHRSSIEIEIEELEDELEWHMDFETTYTKEEALKDTISIFPCAAQFVLNPNYISQITSAPVEIIETANTRFSISEGNLSWRLYPGLDYDEFKENRLPFQIEVHFLKINLLFQIFPEEAQYAKSIHLKIRDVEVFDRVPKSKFRKFFCYQSQDSSRPPRQTESDMIDISFETVRMEREELRLKVTILPIELHIDQDVITFFETFFDESSVEKNRTKEANSHKSDDSSFFQYAEISPVSIRIDYKPKHVNYSSIKQGELMQLINFIHLDEARVYLNGIKVAGIHGWHRLVNKLISIWLPHVKNTQIPYMASGIAGMKTLSNLGTGIADLVLLPIEQYQKDGKVLKGISRGTRSFLKATTTETVRIGSHLAIGAQIMLEKADSKSKKHEQSSDQPQAVPSSLLKPLIRLTESLAETLARLSDSLDGNLISSKSKYKR